MVARVKPESKPAVKLMLDSGAFSAWKRGVEINIDEYCDYIKKHQHLLYNYVTLDQIPGKPNIRKTQAEINASAVVSYKNQQYMKKKFTWAVVSVDGDKKCDHAWIGKLPEEHCEKCDGVRISEKKYLAPIPVFHMGEDFKWLHRYMADGEPYIGISPAADLPQGQIKDWLDEAFTIVCDEDGWPKVKTHGFGVASFALLKRYPWFTCDATSWALTAAFGSILVPQYQGLKPDYTQPPVKLTVSEQEREADMPSDHYLRLGAIAKERVKHFLVHEVNVTVEDAARDNSITKVPAYETRARAIVYFMRRFEEAIGEQPFRHFVREL